MHGRFFWGAVMADLEAQILGQQQGAAPFQSGLLISIQQMVGQIWGSTFGGGGFSTAAAAVSPVVVPAVAQANGVPTVSNPIAQFIFSVPVGVDRTVLLKTANRKNVTLSVTVCNTGADPFRVGASDAVAITVEPGACIRVIANGDGIRIFNGTGAAVATGTIEGTEYVPTPAG